MPWPKAGLSDEQKRLIREEVENIRLRATSRDGRNDRIGGYGEFGDMRGRFASEGRTFKYLHTPLFLQMMLHYHCSPLRFHNDTSPAQQAIIRYAIANGLIRPWGDTYKTTERGAAYVEALKAVRLPAWWRLPCP